MSDNQLEAVVDLITEASLINSKIEKALGSYPITNKNYSQWLSFVYSVADKLRPIKKEASLRADNSSVRAILVAGEGILPNSIILFHDSKVYTVPASDLNLNSFFHGHLVTLLKGNSFIPFKDHNCSYENIDGEIIAEYNDGLLKVINDMKWKIFMSSVKEGIFL